MGLDDEQRRRLQDQALDIRRDIVEITHRSGGAHIGGGLSVVDILVLLYFKHLNIDPQRPDWEDRDRFVLSKGHAAVAFVAVLARRGFFPFEELDTFNTFGSAFGMHPDSLRITGCDASTGSLGHGLPMAVGMALAARRLGKTFRTFCVLGDGECNEGVVWEALMSAAHYSLTNLITIVDRNRLMIDGPTEEIMSLEPLEEKLSAFGHEVLSVNGHDLDELSEAFDRAERVAQAAEGKPVCIVAHTVKGKGVDFMEGQVAWHYGSIDDELRRKARASLDRSSGDERSSEEVLHG